MIPAALIQASIPAFTQSGTGMVRMWPPLPTRLAMTQCSSARRSPQPSRIAKVEFAILGGGPSTQQGRSSRLLS